jgi:hypothetical protein
LGRVIGGRFSELLTKETYFAALKPLLDLQATTIAYAEANDTITGSAYKPALFHELDENDDGIIEYDEKGKGRDTLFMAHGVRVQAVNINNLERLRIRFLLATIPLRCGSKEWNAMGYDFNDLTLFNAAVATAIEMAQAPVETADLFFPDMVWGKGKWPSIQFARYWHVCTQLYGIGFPNSFDIMVTPYGLAFRYADLKWNQKRYIGATRTSAGTNLISKYHGDVEQGARPLPFILYVPPRYGRAGNRNIPNVEETDEPNLIFTASFNDGQEVWRELSLLSIP